MRPDIQQSTAPAALPPAPLARPSARTRPRLRPTAVAVVGTWGILLALLVQQGKEIDRVHRQATEVSRSLDANFSALTASQASLRREIDGLFDPAAIVASARLSVFTLVAGAWQGSAFVVSADENGSALVTNFHVVRSVWNAGVRHVVVRADGRSFNATIVDVHPEADVAIVEVDARLTALPTDGSLPEVGEPVVVVGSPFGFAGTASTGIVSAVRGRYVQFSAPVSPGSSGGPVLDGDGEVLGVTTAKVAGHGAEGLSFAIPIELVCRLTAAC